MYYTKESFIAVMHVRSALMHEHNNALVLINLKYLLCDNDDNKIYN